MDFVLSYFRFLFEEKKLAASTLKSYKSALQEPIKLAFDIDLTDPILGRAMQAFQNLRPAKPVQPITWSLDKVLSFLRVLDSSTTSIF